MPSQAPSQERINQKKLLFSRLDLLKMEAVEASENVSAARINEAQASDQFNNVYFANSREQTFGPVDKTQLTETELEKYDQLQQAKQAHQEAIQRQQILAQEITALQNEIASTSNATTAAEVIAHQQAVDEASQAAEKTRGLIATFGCDLDACSLAPSGTAELEKKYQDALAGFAIGQVTEGEVKELEQQIATVEAAIQGHCEKTGPETKRLKHQLQGLRNLLEQQEAALAVLKAESVEVLTQFLMTEAALVGDRYPELATELNQTFLTLAALDRVLSQQPGYDRAMRILRGSWHEMKIPQFLVGQMRDLDSRDFLFSAEGLGRGDTVQFAVEFELDRIRAMGVRI